MNANAPPTAAEMRTPRPSLADPDILAKARQGKVDAKAARAASTLRKDFLDEPHWVDLASKHGVRLPLWGVPCTPGKMKMWLGRLGFTGEWFREWTGFKRLQEWIDANPLWPLRAFAGLILEEVESGDYHKLAQLCQMT